MSLKEKIITSIKWTTLATIVSASIQILKIAILARYLEKSDFGIMAIIMAIISFSQMFADLGVSSAIIHKQNITKNQLSTLYWLNIIFACVVFGVIFLISPFIASFYKEPILEKLIPLVSIVIVIQSFGKQFAVLFEKEMKFNLLAKIDILTNIINLLLSVTLAVNGFGIYSLIYPAIFTSLLKTSVYFLLGIKYHIPTLYFNLKEVKEFIIFGSYQIGSGLVNYFNSQFDIFLIGKLLGSEVLGLYNIIKQLVMRPAQIINPIITRVTFPAMAKIQEDIDKLKYIYLKTIYYLSLINFFVYIAMIVFSKEIILLFLGNKWLDGNLLFKLLSIYALIRSTGNPIGSLVLARGKPNYEMYWNIALFLFIPITIYIGSFWGIVGVAVALIILQSALIIPNWYFLVKKLCGANFKEYIIQLIKPLIIAIILGLILYLIKTFVGLR